MTVYREILRLFFSLHLNSSDIAKACHVSSKTIVRTKRRAAELGLSWPLPDGMTEEMLSTAMFPKKAGHSSSRRLPDMDYISKRLVCGMSRKELWKEYAEECRKINAKPLKYSGFCRCIQQDQRKRREEHRPSAAPGPVIETVWIPNAASVKDSAAGRVVKHSLFVAAMPGSGYAYAGAFPDMRTASRIRANVRLLGYLGGVPGMIRQVRAPRMSRNPEMDEEYRRAILEFSGHYGTAVIPAGHRKENSSADDGGSAQKAAAWLLPLLEKKSFRSPDLLNLWLRERLEEYNRQIPAGTLVSRENAFRTAERPALSPLPEEPYVFVFWRKTRVQLNCYVTFDYMRYSAPLELAGREADVRVTDTDIEIFVGGERVAAHKRLYGRKGQYSTVYRHWYRKRESQENLNEEQLRRKAREIGSSAEKIALSLLGFGGAAGISPREACRQFLMLSRIYSPEKLEEASRLALELGVNPGYGTVRDILRAKYSKYFGKRKIWWQR